MLGQKCCVCCISRGRNPEVLFHYFPRQQMHPEQRAVCLKVFGSLLFVHLSLVPKTFVSNNKSARLQHNKCLFSI